MGQESMLRMSALAERTGIPVASIKFYLREGLLPPGRRVTDRLAEYDDEHVRRLRLIRLLREVGRVPVDGLRRLVAAVGQPGPLHDLFALAADATTPEPTTAGELRPMTRALVDDLVDRAGWTAVRPEAPAREALAGTLEQVLAFDTHPRDPAELLPYVRLADEIARYEIGHLDGSKDRHGLLEEMVVGQVVFGEILALLRRLAEEHHSHERFGADLRE
ncbi:MerR family transcriptional regulator [Nocardioides eburneiflavus]|uniref:MerR family transcriptional regulator n=1 Tax=Nocardioides eburneiflavus TaxID=2518372 RepID=UPI00143CDFBC|nr:MerR family transcriptional regulator [Nocardioides eburneiflavus]